MDKQELRETIVLKAMFLDKDSLEEIEVLDALVCEALGLESDNPPPSFIFDALNAA